MYLISCYNCCCRYISSLNTAILHFRSLNYINNIISMAMDQETIVSLNKKSESNSTLAKELQIRRETVWKVVKNFRETGQTSNRPGQGRKRIVRTKRMVKNTREKLRTNPRRSATKLAAEAGIRQTSMRRILKEDLKTFPYKMQKRHELTPTHERMMVKRCQHLLNLMEDGMLPNWCSLTRRNLTLNSASTVKMTVFGVGMHPWN